MKIQQTYLNHITREEDCRWTKKPVCPYCGDVIDDWYELDIDNREIDVECGDCGKNYTLFCEKEWTFSSYK
jgi:hypothetical protein